MAQKYFSCEFRQQRDGNVHLLVTVSHADGKLFRAEMREHRGETIFDVTQHHGTTAVERHQHIMEAGKAVQEAMPAILAVVRDATERATKAYQEAMANKAKMSKT